MDGRCRGCEVGEKLKKLQVLRYITAAREKGFEAARREVCGSKGRTAEKPGNVAQSMKQGGEALQ